MVQEVSCALVAIETLGKAKRATRSTELDATPLVMVQFAKLVAHGLRFCSRIWTPFRAHVIWVEPQSASGKSMERVVSITTATL